MFKMFILAVLIGIAAGVFYLASDESKANAKSAVEAVAVSAADNAKTAAKEKAVEAKAVAKEKAVEALDATAKVATETAANLAKKTDK